MNMDEVIAKYYVDTITKIIKDSHQKGYAEGFDAGYRKGYSGGRDDAAVAFDDALESDACKCRECLEEVVRGV
jgi:flagellar biosynthesis/type III secretory pathway protein FliH